MIQKAKDSKTLNLTTSGSFNSTGFFPGKEEEKEEKTKKTTSKLKGKPNTFK